MRGGPALATIDDSDKFVRAAIKRVETCVARVSRSEAPDIVQEALTRAVRHGVACDAEPWLKTVARRIAIDRSRRTHEVASGGTGELERLASPSGMNPEDIFIANETFGVVRKALEAMPARYRDALLTYAEAQETATVSERFGISANATWSLLCRARARLRQELDRVGYAYGLVCIKFQRWQQEIATVGAAACVAAAVALSGPTAAGADRVQVARPSVAVASATVPQMAQRPAAIVPPTNETAGEAAPVPVEEPRVAQYKLTACGPRGEPLPVGVEAYVVDESSKSLTGELIKKLPEPLRVLEADTCRD